MGWYANVAKDISNIPGAADFFEDELLEAKPVTEVIVPGGAGRAARKFDEINVFPNSVFKVFFAEILTKYVKSGRNMLAPNDST